MIPNREALVYGAITGSQGKIVGTNVSQAGTLTRADLEGNTGSVSATQPLAGAGSLAAGTYYYWIPTAGCTSLDVTLRLSAGTAPTITLYPTLSDNISIKGTATSVSTITSTQATTSLTTLRGERGCILKLVAAAVFTIDQADYSCL